ncbi:MAG: hypothetical protein Q8940_14700 [Bacteroidota bacterium]|nr:hypothetical protein [Bacteroidota bacterium]
MRRCSKLFYLLAFWVSLSYIISANNAQSIENCRIKQITYPEYPPHSMDTIPALNFKDTDIRDILRSIAYEYQTNIVIDNSINNRISAALFNVTLFSAVKMIAMDNGFDFSFDNERFYIRPKKTVVPPPPVEPEPEVSFNQGKLSIKLNNADINRFVNKLRAVTGKNFLLNSGTSGRLTGELSNIELETGLKNILQNNGYYFTLTDSIYYISRSSYFSSTDATNNPQSRNGSYWVNAKSGRVTLDVNQANLDQVLNDIFRQLNLQIVKLASPNATVTVKCSDAQLDVALSYLFEGTEFSFRKNNGAYVVGPKTSKSIDNTRLIYIKYLRADKVKEMLPPTLLQTVNVSVSIEHNGLVIMGNEENVNNLESYLAAIDKPVPQVLIEALVVDYNLNDLFQLGITAGQGDSSVTNRTNKFYPSVDATLSGSKINSLLNSIGSVNLFGKEFDVAKLGKLPDNFYLNLKAMEQSGIANVKSKPILSSLSGHKASLKIGTVQNYVFDEIMPITSQVNSTYIQQERIEKIEANISFEITPWVGSNNELTLEIKPEFQTPIGQFVPDKKLIPAINTRSMVSTVRLRDGETIVLGGLIQDSESNTEDKFPILGDIPFLGKLFTNVNKTKTKAELIIYLTPKIFYEDDFGNSYYEYAK